MRVDFQILHYKSFLHELEPSAELFVPSRGECKVTFHLVKFSFEHHSIRCFLLDLPLLYFV